jgi:hypothetical protein
VTITTWKKSAAQASVESRVGSGAPESTAATSSISAETASW